MWKGIIGTWGAHAPANNLQGQPFFFLTIANIDLNFWNQIPIVIIFKNIVVKTKVKKLGNLVLKSFFFLKKKAI